MNNTPLRKLTINDLLDFNDTMQTKTSHKYGIENNQKKYSRNQKCKP